MKTTIDKARRVVIPAAMRERAGLSPGSELEVKSLAVSVFLDTSVLLGGLVDFGPQSAPAQSLLHEVAEKRVTALRRHGIAVSNSFP